MEKHEAVWLQKHGEHHVACVQTLPLLGLGHAGSTGGGIGHSWKGGGRGPARGGGSGGKGPAEINLLSCFLKYTFVDPLCSLYLHDAA